MALCTFLVDSADLLFPVLLVDVADRATFALGGTPFLTRRHRISGVGIGAPTESPAVEMQDHLDRPRRLEVVRHDDDRHIVGGLLGHLLFRAHDPRWMLATLVLRLEAPDDAVLEVVHLAARGFVTRYVLLARRLGVALRILILGERGALHGADQPTPESVGCAALPQDARWPDLR